MSYNVGNFFKYLPFNDNIDMIASMIKESEADVVALNEIDSLTQRLPYDEGSLSLPRHWEDGNGTLGVRCLIRVALTARVVSCQAR